MAFGTGHNSFGRQSERELLQPPTASAHVSEGTHGSLGRVKQWPYTPPAKAVPVLTFRFTGHHGRGARRGRGYPYVDRTGQTGIVPHPAAPSAVAAGPLPPCRRGPSRTGHTPVPTGKAKGSRHSVLHAAPAGKPAPGTPAAYADTPGFRIVPMTAPHPPTAGAGRRRPPPTTARAGAL